MTIRDYPDVSKDFQKVLCKIVPSVALVLDSYIR